MRVAHNTRKRPVVDKRRLTMNECDICKQRILVYPGTCDDCRRERQATAEAQWAPSYEARTAAINAQTSTTSDAPTRSAEQEKADKRYVDGIKRRQNAARQRRTEAAIAKRGRARKAGTG